MQIPRAEAGVGFAYSDLSKFQRRDLRVRLDMNGGTGGGFVEELTIGKRGEGHCMNH